MKKLFLIIGMILFLFDCLDAQTTITGTLLGFDGKPMILSNVILTKVAPEIKIASVEVSKEGRYTISTDEKGPYFIKYGGLNNTTESILLLTDGFANEKIDVKLEGKQYLKSKYPPKVMGEFNDFNQATAKEMQMLPDSTYSLVMETKEEKFKFILIVGLVTASNGTQPAGYEYDSKGRYVTVLKPIDGKVEIVFDPSKLITSDSKAEIKFEKTSQLSKIAYAYLKGQSISREYINTFLSSIINSKKLSFDITNRLNEIDAALRAEQDAVVKQVLALAQAEVAGYNIPPDEKLSEKISLELISLLNPDSFLLTLNSSGWIGTVFNAKGIDIPSEKVRREYVDKFLETSIIPKETKAKLIMNILSLAKATYNEPVRKKYYELMSDKYIDTDAAKQLKQYSTEFNLVVGSVAPKFSLPSLENPKVIYTNDSFKGKIYMIDFWATWCGPCKAELPELHRVYEKYHSKGLEILSISFDQNVEAINKYRQGEMKMPWDHVFASGEIKAKLAKDFDAASIPKPFLIDGDTGKILALTTDLRGENLEKTLEKYIK